MKRVTAQQGDDLNKRFRHEIKGELNTTYELKQYASLLYITCLKGFFHTIASRHL